MVSTDCRRRHCAEAVHQVALSPTPTATVTVTRLPSPTPSATPTGTATRPLTPTAAPTVTRPPTPTATPTATRPPTLTTTPTRASTATGTPRVTPTPPQRRKVHRGIGCTCRLCSGVHGSAESESSTGLLPPAQPPQHVTGTCPVPVTLARVTSICETEPACAQSVPDRHL